MAGTKIVAVRSALTDALAALPEFADARVDMTWSAKAQVREQVFTTSAKFTHEPAGMRGGRVHRNEDGAFDLVVMVTTTDDMTSTSERAVVLGTVAEEWVADNKNGEALSVDGLNWITVSGDGGVLELYEDRSFRALVSYSVTYQARLT